MSKSISREFPYLLRRVEFIDESLCRGYREVVERDRKELLLSVHAESWKAALVLTGSLMEGLLYCFLKRNETFLREARNEPDFSVDPESNLADLLSILRGRLWSKEFDYLPDSVVSYRDIVHPNNEIVRRSLVVNDETVRQSLSFLNRLLKHLDEFSYD